MFGKGLDAPPPFALPYPPKRLAWAIKIIGWSQGQFARRIDRDEKHVTKLLSGKSDIADRLAYWVEHLAQLSLHELDPTMFDYTQDWLKWAMETIGWLPNELAYRLWMPREKAWGIIEGNARLEPHEVAFVHRIALSHLSMPMPAEWSTRRDLRGTGDVTPEEKAAYEQRYKRQAQTRGLSRRI